MKLFKVDNVAPIQILSDITGAARMFSLGGTADIPYPSADMAKKLLDERTGPAKTVFVVPDAPKDTFYIFALAGRQERGVEEFRRTRYEQQGRGQVFNLLMISYGLDSADKVKKSVLGMLRKEFNYAETDAQKAKLDDRDKKGEE